LVAEVGRLEEREQERVEEQEGGGAGGWRSRRVHQG